jgi:hypothetical protein
MFYSLFGAFFACPYIASANKMFYSLFSAFVGFPIYWKCQLAMGGGGGQ